MTGEGNSCFTGPLTSGYEFHKLPLGFVSAVYCAGAFGGSLRHENIPLSGPTCAWTCCCVRSAQPESQQGDQSGCDLKGRAASVNPPDHCVYLTARQEKCLHSHAGALPMDSAVRGNEPQTIPKLSGVTLTTPKLTLRSTIFNTCCNNVQERGNMSSVLQVRGN